MNTVAIVGVGLIGGSFGLALREAGFAGEILGVSSAPALESALRLGAISATATLDEAVQHADLVYLSQPVDRILESLETLGRLDPAHCLITDAGSTKAVIVRKAAGCLRSATFLGGHPIAGKEQRGVEAADPHLFRDRLYVLTPTGADSDAIRDFRAWVQRIGAYVVDLTAEQHDATVAFTSHLPQLLSTALAGTLAKQPNPQIRRVFGPGLLDMTRLALSSPDLWFSIIETNKEDVSKALDAIIRSLTDIKNHLSDDNFMKFFVSAASFASEIRVVDSTKSAL